jgi:trans-aconitate 2-methyltransferase
MPWNPDQYEKFKEARYAPFDDLVALIQPRPGLKVIDLGCGTGELTRRLADLLPDSDVLGIDNSPEMLAKAAVQKRVGLRFECRAIEDVEGEWDVVFSHAAIQWVNDHPHLIPRLMGMVRPGGQIAVQLPSNHRHLSHVLLGEIASDDPFRAALHGWRREFPVLSIGKYAELLFKNGGENITVFEKIYPVILKDSDGMAEWTAGTALVPYMERLPEELHAPFMERYQTLLHERWPDSPVFYAFQRTLFGATVPTSGWATA